MAEVRFFKVPSTQTLPTIGIPNSWYLKKTSGGFDIYLSDDNGNLVPANAGGGGSDTYTGIAGENLGGGKLVYLQAGKFYLFDANNIALADMVFGITKTAALINTSVDIQISGVYTEVGLGLTADTEYYAGINGLMVSDSTPYSTSTLMGIALTPDTFKIEIQQTIIIN